MDLYDKISELGKRRGIIFPSFEIYGGLSGFFDYGPLGTTLKRNLVNKWLEMFVYKEGMVEIESTIILPATVFEASGHIAHFTDVMTKCKECNEAYRIDHVIEEAGIEVREGLKPDELNQIIKKENIRCPKCSGELEDATVVNLMFKVDIGPYGRSVVGYGRPEAAQGQFVDFKRIYMSERERLPLGIAQVAKCLRNEIAPRKGPIRLREFTIIDYEIFFDPMSPSYTGIDTVKDLRLRLLTAKAQVSKTSQIREVTVDEALKAGLIGNEIQAYFLALSIKYMEELGVPFENQRLREQLPEEKAHYSKQTFDQEVWLERWGWTEISGSAYRTDYDLSRHMMYSGEDLRVFEPYKKPKKVKKIELKLNKELIRKDFGSEANRIISLLSKSDPGVLKKIFKETGKFEVPGMVSVYLKKQHVNFDVVEEEVKGRYFLSHVIEPSFGVDRIFYSILEYSYTERNGRIILRIPPDVAPVKAFVLPLVNKDGLPELADEVYKKMINHGINVKYDDSGSIGKSYARSDEIGVPICVTIDYDSVKDETVTLRDRDSWKQVRVKSDDLTSLILSYIKGEKQFEELGIRVEKS